jgi:hypothetical protein
MDLMAAPTVLERVLPLARIEGERTSLPASGRYAVVASWGPDARVSRSLAAMVVGLEEQGYSVVVVRASEDDAPLDWSGLPAHSAVVVRKPNIGYDFGSWATAFEMFPEIRAARYVITANDSLVGPFGSLEPMVRDFEDSFYDVWGSTWTTQFMPHLQSFLLGFRGGILDDPVLRHFWSGLPEQTIKSDIIHKYELGLNRLLQGEGYVTGAWMDYNLVVRYSQNPVILGWKRLVELGFPFVKRELVRSPHIVPDGDDVPAEIQRIYGIDPREWM